MTPKPFEALPLAAPIQRALAQRGYTTPSPIQAQAIPILLQGRDLLGCAQTGTGKTAAFSLPILDSLSRNPRKCIPKCARVLVLTPTRELASQVGKSLETYGKHLNFRHALIYGGVGQNPQVSAMRRGVDVLVACPGRLLDLCQQGHIDLSRVEFFVLDEVDRMLDMGFQRDVQKIVDQLPKRRQSLFFSATLANPIVKLAHEILVNPATVTIEPELTTAEKVEQRVCFVAKENKKNLLLQKLGKQGAGELTIVFSRTKHGANKLAKQISAAGFDAQAIHGNRSQAQRDRTLDQFRAGNLPVLVATDVAARGIDIPDVAYVINYDLPEVPDNYVHRIGRTARAGRTGEAIAFCAPDEMELLLQIEKTMKITVPTGGGERPVSAMPSQGPRRKGGPRRGGKPGGYHAKGGAPKPMGSKPLRPRRRRAA